MGERDWNFDGIVWGQADCGGFAILPLSDIQEEMKRKEIQNRNKKKQLVGGGGGGML